MKFGSRVAGSGLTEWHKQSQDWCRGRWVQKTARTLLSLPLILSGALAFTAEVGGGVVVESFGHDVRR